jgi:putative Holliday junction resolvase
MSRIVAIDFGRKRSGIAVSDPQRIIANPLITVETSKLIVFLKKYISEEVVGEFVVGDPKTMENTKSDVYKYLNPFLGRLKKEIPNIPINKMDERFTSRMAFQTMIDAGLGKKARQNKELVDSISATIILQSYMETKNL